MSICIDSVSYRKVRDENWTEAKLLKNRIVSRTGQIALTYVQDGTTQVFGNFPEDISQNRPAGGDASIWSMESARHKGGDEYFVSVWISTFPYGFVQSPLDLSAGIRPIRVTTPGDVFGYEFPNNVRQYQFPEGFEYRIKVRLGNLLPKLSKWYSASLKSPQISISDQTLEISGQPVKVPVVASAPAKCNDLTSDQRNALSAGTLEGIRSYCETSGSGISIYTHTMDNGIEGFKLFQAFESDLYEIGKNSTWALSANANLGECNSNDVTGFISSNALLYSPNPPTFDKQSQTLVYRMASLHYDQAGEVNTGNLELVLRKSVANCLWNTDNLNLNQALVTISYSNGTSVVGTSTLKTDGNWIYLNITNFTFSNPEVRIKLASSFDSEIKTSSPTTTQNATPTPTPTPSIVATPTPSAVATPQPTASAKKPLVVKTTCVKGKITKVVTGTKCPTGYKKK
jgi:hypothetical protein